MSVRVRGDRIIRVGPDADLSVPGAEVIDGRNRFLMPGLWDNHQHFSDIDGPLDLANGVTSDETWRMTRVLFSSVSRVSMRH